MKMREANETFENVVFVSHQNKIVERIKEAAKVAFNVRNVAVKDYSVNSPIMRLLINTGKDKRVYEIEISELELVQRCQFAENQVLVEGVII